MNGFLNIDKPAGLTSHDVVARVRRLAGRGVKVGHAGTLDPMATGVLPVALGSATRLIEYLADAHKGYRGVVRLGQITSTDDAEGEILEDRPVPPLSDAQIAAALAQFRGPIMQVPPIYSALHHEGRRLYDLARAGLHVDLPPRPVTIYRLELVPHEGEPDQTADDRRPTTALLPAADAAGHASPADPATPHTFTLDIACSKGTYIRALARDIGAALGCGAHLAALRRTQVGAFQVDAATPLAALERDPALLTARLHPPELAVRDWPAIALDERQAARVRNGMALDLPAPEGDHARAHTEGGALLALLRREGGAWRPIKVFHD